VDERHGLSEHPVQSELPRPGIAPYTATKGAIKNLTRGMCADWAKYGLQVIPWDDSDSKI
jgi:NAD(P)-dependent dehydrogenase (short-subunit alcohol dehydrogenase family)